MKTYSFKTCQPKESSSRIYPSLPTVIAVVFLTAAFTTRLWAQAPNLLWETNVNAQLFAVDAKTNAYASVGGSVVKINGNGAVLETTAICPRPGVVRRDDSGSYYFGGNFDGVVDFGGIMLMGGWTNGPFPGGGWVPGHPTCFLAKYAGNGDLQWVVSFGAQASSNYVTDVLVDGSGACYAGFVQWSSPRPGSIVRVSPAGTNEWQRTTLAYEYSLAVRLGGLTSSNCCVLNFRNVGVDQIQVGRVDSAGNHSVLGQYPLLARTEAASYGKPVIDDLARPLAVGRCFDPIFDPICSAQVLRKYGAGTSVIWDREVTPEAQWTLARDPQANLYLAGTNGMLAKYDSEGSIIWSNNFSNIIVGMVVDESGNRFVSFANGSIGRLVNDPSAVPRIIGGQYAAPGFSFQIEGNAPTFRVWAGSNLNTWSSVGIVTNSGGSAQFTDVTATNAPARFYRAESMP